MIERMKENWRRYRASKPGRRFQDRYRRQESEHGWQDPRKLFYVVGGLTIARQPLARSAPWSWYANLLCRLGMIAGEVRPVARLLDWAKVRARELGRWVRGVWRSSAAGKVLVVSVAAGSIPAPIPLVGGRSVRRTWFFLEYFEDAGPSIGSTVPPVGQPLFLLISDRFDHRLPPL